MIFHLLFFIFRSIFDPFSNSSSFATDNFPAQQRQLPISFRERSSISVEPAPKSWRFRADAVRSSHPRDGKVCQKKRRSFRAKVGQALVTDRKYGRRRERRGILFTPRIDSGGEKIARPSKKGFLVIVVLVERYFPLDRFNFQRELV